MPTSAQGKAPSITIDMASVIQTLSTKHNVNWQDGAFNLPEVQAARRAAYHTSAAAASIPAFVTLPGGNVSTSAPCYVDASLQGIGGPSPNADDLLYVVSDGGTLYALNATNLSVVSSRSGLGSFSHSVVFVSADNQRIYLVTTTGKLLILAASTLATLATVTLSGSGFTGATPYCDYAAIARPLAHEDMYVVANDGTINRVQVVPAGASVTTTFTSWSAGGALNYGGAITVSDIPIVWNGIAYFGDTAGNFFAVNISSASVTSYNLASFTSAEGAAHAITAPPALDLDPATAQVQAVFVPCGDRLDWIDPTTGTVTPSSALVLDKNPGSPYAGTLASVGATTANQSYTATDWISIAAKNPSPSRWGGPSSNPVYNTGITGYTIKFDPFASQVWAGNSNNNTIFPMDLSGTQLGSYSTNTYGYPNELCMDKNGNCWVSTQKGTVVKYSPTGSVLATSSNIGALWPQSDSAGSCWVTNQGKTVYKLNSNGTTAFSINDFKTAFSVITDSANDAWVTDYSNNDVMKISAAGATSTPYAVGSRPAYIAIDPTTGNLWTADNGGNTVTELSGTTGAKLAQWSVAKGPWCVAFDPSGHLWVSDVSPGNGVEEIDKATGNVIQTFNMSSFGNAYEMTFDSNGFGWVATDNGILKISPLGNLEDVFASTYYGTPGDGNDSYGYSEFSIPQNSFSNYPVLGTKLLLTANSTPIAPENLNFFEASAYQGGGGNTLWAGYAGTPNVDYNNRPAVTGPVSSSTNLSVTSGTQYGFSVPAIGDQLNTSDAGNARWAFAEQSQGEALQSAAHWYSNLSATKSAQDPTLQVTLDTGAKFPNGNGISSEPEVDQLNHRVWVESCNALFQLDYSSANHFQSPAKTLYNLTQTGRNSGPTTGNGANKTYLFSTGNVVTDGQHIVCLDSGPALNDYGNPLTGATDKLRYYASGPAGVGTIGPYIIWNYVGGDVYLTTSTGYVVRASVLQ
ncbi:MAG TPA: hypothetical protein V6D47_05235 [Oscillatoriaceae cyanobacterium]